MKIIFLLLIFSTSTFANSTLLCDENGNPIEGIAAQLAIPNCLTPSNLESAIKDNDQSKVCGSCKEKFQQNANKIISPLSDKARKEKFIASALNEYKKSLTDNLTETLKLRALRPTGAAFDKSISSCKMKNIDEISKGCSGEVKSLIKESGIFKDLSSQISNELAKLISQDSTFNPANTLLKRDQASCFVSEKDLLLISSQAAEEALSPALINAIINLEGSESTTLNHMLLDESISDEYEGDISELAQNLTSHPLLAEHVKDPQSFIQFLKTIPNPKSLENLRATIYSKESGNEFDSKLAENCQKSFETLNKALCSNDFKNGNFNLDAFSNHKKIFNVDVPTNQAAFTVTETLINQNVEALRLCEVKSHKLGLLKVNQDLNKNLRNAYQDLTFDEFKEFKYKTEIGNLNTYICSNASRPCPQDTFECKVLQKYNDLKNSGSLESKLARSSNKEVNDLLRSMIGDTSRIEPKTKEILIANGIIPRDDGTIVEQPDIPERRPEFFANENSNQNNAPTRTNVVQNVANTTKNRPTDRTPASNENYSNVSNNTSPNQQSFADFSDILDDSSDELKSIQDEIRRRLSDMPESNQGNRNQTKQIVRESFRKKGRTLTPAQENAITDRILNAPVAQAQSQFADSSGDDTNDAAVSDAESEIERWRNGQRDAALMGMAGAQQVAARNGDRAPASVEAQKDLTKIALNLPEDPKIKLSDIFFNKLNTNDSETQLLKVMMKNKSNFLLQINSLNFRVIFNQNNTFNLLLENGNSTEAERIRPQLEMFLRRLKS